MDSLHARSAAKRALYETGFELAGVRLQDFAEAVLVAVDASPTASVDQLVDRALKDIEGDPIALVAEEPLLRDLPLAAPARTVSEAAETALHALARRLLDVSG
jgi:hypothetical protein